MGKQFHMYLPAYREAIAGAAANSHVIRPEVWIAAKWETDHNLDPWQPQYHLMLAALLHEDPELASAIIAGHQIMAKLAGGKP